MNKIKHIVLTIAMLAIATIMQAKQQTVYVFGISTCFNDSVVYITDIQEISGAYVDDDRNHFLTGRNGYSDQLRNHFANAAKPNRTCATFWATTRKDIEKKYQKVLAKYGIVSTDGQKAKKKSKKVKRLEMRYQVRMLTTQDFAYKAVSPDEGTVYVDAAKAEEAARKSKHKRDAPKR